MTEERPKFPSQTQSLLYDILEELRIIRIATVLQISQTAPADMRHEASKLLHQLIAIETADPSLSPAQMLKQVEDLNEQFTRSATKPTADS